MNAQWPSSRHVSGQTSKDQETSPSEKVSDDLQRVTARKSDTNMERISLNALLYHVLFAEGFL